MKKPLCLIIVCGLLGALCGLAAAAKSEEIIKINMTVGEQRIFTVKGVTKLTASGTKAADVKVVGKDQFVIYALKEGRATFGVLRKGKPPQNWQVTVRGRSVAEFKVSCAELMGSPCTDLKVHSASGKVVLSGQANDLETYHKVRKLKKAFPDVVFLVDVNPRVLDALVGVINEELKRNGLNNARVNRIAEKLMIEGTVSDESEKRKAKIIVDALYDAALGKD